MSSIRLNPVINIEEETPFKTIHEKHDENDASIIRRWTIGKSFLRRVHILSWIREYDRNKAIADLIAGITLGMTMIPQSIAYASLAELSSQYGLYSSFVGSFVYVIMGTIPQVSIGPTSLMALMTLQFTKHLPVQFAVMLAFMSGVSELAMGLFNLGFVVNFISQPVTSAFTTGTSAIVILVQLKALMGVKGNHFSFNTYFLDQLSIGDSVLGLTCIGVLLSLRQLSRIEFSTTSTFRSILKRFLWYISISRNAIVVFCSSLVAYHLINKDGRDSIPFTLSTKVNSTSPSLQFPPFIITHGNITYLFIDICKELGSGLFVVPIIAVLANVAIAKAFVKDSSLDASQEMLTLGVCNIAGSFFNAMPTCGAFTRSAVSQASGVKTPLSGIYSDNTKESNNIIQQQLGNDLSVRPNNEAQLLQPKRILQSNSTTSVVIPSVEVSLDKSSTSLPPVPSTSQSASIISNQPTINEAVNPVAARGTRLVVPSSVVSNCDSSLRVLPPTLALPLLKRLKYGAKAVDIINFIRSNGIGTDAIRCHSLTPENLTDRISALFMLLAPSDIGKVLVNPNL